MIRPAPPARVRTLSMRSGMLVTATIAVLACAPLAAQPDAGARGASEPRSEATTGAVRVEAGLLILRGLDPPSGAAVTALMAAVQRRTAVETVIAAPPRLRPVDPELFNTPLLLLTGGTAFEPLSDREVDALRTYLTSGGMLIADDTSGQKDSGFARSVRAQMSRVLGGRPFEPLPVDHAIFRSYYLIDGAWGRVDVSRDLEAIRVSGRAAVVLSPNDVLGAGERDATGAWARPVDPGGSRQRELAIRLGVNMVVYALTLDYKEDLVHLPMILERKR